MLGLRDWAIWLTCLGALGCGGTDPGGSGAAGAGGAPVMLEPGPTCIAFCAHVVGDCQIFTFDEASCRQGCEENLLGERTVSAACGDAVEAVFQCITELDCQGVQAALAATSADQHPCPDEVRAVEVLHDANPACAQVDGN